MSVGLTQVLRYVAAESIAELIAEEVGSEALRGVITLIIRRVGGQADDAEIRALDGDLIAEGVAAILNADVSEAFERLVPLVGPILSNVVNFDEIEAALDMRIAQLLGRLGINITPPSDIIDADVIDVSDGGALDVDLLDVDSGLEPIVDIDGLPAQDATGGWVTSTISDVMAGDLGPAGAISSLPALGGSDDVIAATMTTTNIRRELMWVAQVLGRNPADAATFIIRLRSLLVQTDEALLAVGNMDV